MNFFTVRTFWAESINVIFAQFVYIVVKLAQKASSTKTPIKIRAVFSSFFFSINVSVNTLFSFLTLTFLHEVLARRNFRLNIHMQILTMISFFALVFEPVHTYGLLTLSFINYLFSRFNNRANLVYTQLILILYRHW